MKIYRVEWQAVELGRYLEGVPYRIFASDIYYTTTKEIALERCPVTEDNGLIKIEEIEIFGCTELTEDTTIYELVWTAEEELYSPLGQYYLVHEVEGEIYATSEEEARKNCPITEEQGDIYITVTDIKINDNYKYVRKD